MSRSGTPLQGPILVRHRVRPEFRGLIAGIVGYTERSDHPVVRRQVAGTLIPLILSSGPTLDVLDAPDRQGANRFGSFVAGIMPCPVTTSFDTEQRCIQIYLTPLGAFRLLGVPDRELAAHVVDVDDVVPVFGQPLLDELWSTPSWKRRFDLIDRTILDLLACAPQPEPFVMWMWQQIERSGGQSRIGDLVKQTGWSHRHVITGFTEQIGLTPKLASNVVRFERAVSALRSRPAAEVAAELGFADQSHLVREVKRFAGGTPSTLPVAQLTTAHSAIGSKLTLT